MKKKKAYKNRKSTNQIGLRHLTIILCALVYFCIGIIIEHFCSFDGSAAFFTVFPFVLTIILGFPFALMEIVSKNTREHMGAHSFYNARRVLVFGNIIAFLYATVISVLILVFMDKIKLAIFAMPSSEFLLKLFIPLIFASSIGFVFKGFFMGAKLKIQLYLSFLFEGVAILLGILIFHGFYAGHSKNVANLLYSESIVSVFNAAGCSIGITIGSIVSTGICIAFYYIAKKGLQHGDYTRRHVDIYDLGANLLKGSIILGFCTFNYPLVMVIFTYILNKALSDESNALKLYSTNAHLGIVGIMIFVPLLITYLYSFFDRRSVAIAVKSGDRQEIFFKINDMKKKFAIYYFPFVAFCLGSSAKFSYIITGSDSAFASKIIAMCIPAGIFMGLSMIFINILIGVGELLFAMISSLLSLVLASAACYIFTGLIGFNAGFVIGLYVFAIIYSFLSYVFLRKYMKHTDSFMNIYLRPIIAMVPAFVLSLLLNLLFGLFMPPAVSIIISGIIIGVIVYFFYIRTGVTNYTSVTKSPISAILLPLGRVMGLDD